MTDIGALLYGFQHQPVVLTPTAGLSVLLDRWLHHALFKGEDHIVQPRGFSPFPASGTREAPSTCLWDEWVNESLNLENLH